jgi:hypothetical protein
VFLAAAFLARPLWAPPLPPPDEGGEGIILPAEGLYYYAIEDLKTGEVAARGRIGLDRVLHPGVLLVPDRLYCDWALHAETQTTAFNVVRMAGAGQSLQPPPMKAAFSVNADDSDGDGLHDLAEFIIGTDKRHPDTDGDGVGDLAEALEGSNPLDPGLAIPGVVAVAPSPSASYAAAEVAAVLDETLEAVAATFDAGGTTVWNVYARMEPIAAARALIPGGAKKGCWLGQGRLALVDGSGGVRVVDFSQPAAPLVGEPLALEAPALCVASAGQGKVLAGLETGALVLMDFSSGAAQSLALGESVAAVAFSESEALAYCVTLGAGGDTLRVASFSVSSLPQEIFSVPSPAGADSPGEEPRRQLFWEGAKARVCHAGGYNLFALSNPRAPALAAQISGEGQWRGCVLVESGLAAAVVERGDQAWTLVYDETAATPLLTRELELGATTRGVSAVNGLAYATNAQGSVYVVNCAPRL